jgi:hypothetical protein
LTDVRLKRRIKASFGKLRTDDLQQKPAKQRESGSISIEQPGPRANAGS